MTRSRRHCVPSPVWCTISRPGALDHASCARIVSSSARSGAAEALDLLKAWGTGHPRWHVATIHAGSAHGRAYTRLEQLILEVSADRHPAR